jgi:hypothetical protein
LAQTLPFNLNFVSTTQGGYTIQNGVITYNLGTVPAGGSVAFTLTMNPAAAGVYSSTATLAEDQTDLNLIDNTATVSTTVINPAAPHLSNPSINGGTFTLTITGVPGQYILQGSSDLINWTTISTNSVPPQGTTQLIDPNASSFSYHYYRAAFIGP